ncbi:MAG: pantoate--beta-alanine ligase [Candidatus Magnetoglobus multicellularis str. Araruama]|uniref:Pantothenate synthetase n=1 Tax=Candidatus Magnetoglobus multicellularis str. Araruama TaxID=890399 RepID=A0A1V1PIB6_9BACT|nr:MAG: pantoate--beta-alanine ligase [Candidatus Magnetoglobus multicellularis str. Araruama]
MKVIQNPKEIQKLSEDLRKQNYHIGFVPTMGYLHKGHISLLNAARKQSDYVVLSIFVNPTQFGPLEDLSIYPNDLPKDLAEAEQAGVDFVFTPTEKVLYGSNYQTFINLNELPNHLCGLHRPIHFQGVATIVAKLFNIVKPHKAFFGEKDYQQLAVIRQMVKDLNFSIEIIGCPIVREDDGLAMSSRNVFLSELQRKSALYLNKALNEAQQHVFQGIIDSKTLIANTHEMIAAQPETKIEYIHICDKDTLIDLPSVNKDCLMALAVRVGQTRLIDNTILFIKK